MKNPKSVLNLYLIAKSKTKFEKIYIFIIKNKRTPPKRQFLKKKNPCARMRLNVELTLKPSVGFMMTRHNELSWKVKVSRIFAGNYWCCYMNFKTSTKE